MSDFRFRGNELHRLSKLHRRSILAMALGVGCGLLLGGIVLYVLVELAREDAGGRRNR